MNSMTLYNALPSIDTNLITSVEYKEAKCYCPYHQGCHVQQVSFKAISSGKLIIVMEDSKGYHVSVGLWEEDVPPPVVSPSELRKIIIEALYCD